MAIPFFGPFVSWAPPVLVAVLVMPDATLPAFIAMGIGWFRRGHRDLTYYSVFAAVLWCCWNAGTLIGATFGADIKDPQRFGVDFAITASFVAIVVLGVRHRADAVVAVVAVLVAAGLRLAGASAVTVVVAGALAPVVAFALRESRE